MFRLLALVLCAQCLSAAEQPSKLWWSSVVAMAAASAVDGQTSVGRFELNPILKGAQGGYDPLKGALLKSGIAALTIAPQYLLVRKYPRFAKLFSVVNFGLAGTYGATAYHNTTVPLFHPKK